MKKRELIQLMVGLSYSTGYDHAQKIQELEHWHEVALDRNYKDGQEQERERILELLKDYLPKVLANHGLVLIQEQYAFLEGLIKGTEE